MSIPISDEKVHIFSNYEEKAYIIPIHFKLYFEKSFEIREKFIFKSKLSFSLMPII